MYVYPWWIHVDVWWKSSQYCKGILLQLKVKQNLKKIKLKKETGQNCEKYKLGYKNCETEVTSLYSHTFFFHEKKT